MIEFCQTTDPPPVAGQPGAPFVQVNVNGNNIRSALCHLLVNTSNSISELLGSVDNVIKVYNVTNFDNVKEITSNVKDATGSISKVFDRQDIFMIIFIVLLIILIVLLVVFACCMLFRTRSEYKKAPIRMKKKKKQQVQPQPQSTFHDQPYQPMPSPIPAAPTPATTVTGASSEPIFTLTQAQQMQHPITHATPAGSVVALHPAQQLSSPPTVHELFTPVTTTDPYTTQPVFTTASIVTLMDQRPVSTVPGSAQGTPPRRTSTPLTTILAPLGSNVLDTPDRRISKAPGDSRAPSGPPTRSGSKDMSIILAPLGHKMPDTPTRRLSKAPSHAASQALSRPPTRQGSKEPPPSRIIPIETARKTPSQKSSSSSSSAASIPTQKSRPTTPKFGVPTPFREAGVSYDQRAPPPAPPLPPPVDPNSKGLQIKPETAEKEAQWSTPEGSIHSLKGSGGGRKSSGSSEGSRGSKKMVQVPIERLEEGEIIV